MLLSQKYSAFRTDRPVQKLRLGPADSPRSFIEERPCSLFARLKEEEEESNEVTLSVSRSLTLLLLFLFSFGSGQLGQDTHETDEGLR